MLKYTLNREQYNTLEALAAWNADKAYMIEKWGHDEPELEKVHDNIVSLFPVLDRQGVPMWLQNVVLSFSNDWRREKSRYLSSYLETVGGYEIKIDWRA